MSTKGFLVGGFCALVTSASLMSCGGTEESRDPKTQCIALQAFETCLGLTCQEAVTLLDACLFEKSNCREPYQDVLTCATTCDAHIATCGRTWVDCFVPCNYESTCVAQCNADRASCIGVEPSCDSRFAR